MADADLHGIVQRMIDAGESEDNIATVIQHFQSQSAQPSGPVPLRQIIGEELSPAISYAKEIGKGALSAVNPMGFLRTGQALVNDPLGTAWEMAKGPFKLLKGYAQGDPQSIGALAAGLGVSEGLGAGARAIKGALAGPAEAAVPAAAPMPTEPLSRMKASEFFKDTAGKDRGAALAERLRQAEGAGVEPKAPPRGMIRTSSAPQTSGNLALKPEAVAEPVATPTSASVPQSQAYPSIARPEGGWGNQAPAQRGPYPAAVPSSQSTPATTGDALRQQFAEQTVAENAALRGTPADVPNNPVAQQLEQARQAAQPTEPTAVPSGDQLGQITRPDAPLIDKKYANELVSMLEDRFAKHGYPGVRITKINTAPENLELGLGDSSAHRIGAEMDSRLRYLMDDPRGQISIAKLLGLTGAGAMVLGEGPNAISTMARHPLATGATLAGGVALRYPTQSAAAVRAALLAHLLAGTDTPTATEP